MLASLVEQLLKVNRGANFQRVLDAPDFFPEPLAPARLNCLFSLDCLPPNPYTLLFHREREQVKRTLPFQSLNLLVVLLDFCLKLFLTCFCPLADLGGNLPVIFF